MQPSRPRRPRGSADYSDQRVARPIHGPAPAQHVGDHVKTAALSIITGGGKWVEISIAADPLYQHLLLTAEKKFWRCVEFGEPPRLFGVEPPRARVEAVRVVDMGQSNSWAEFAAVYRNTRAAFLEHEKAEVVDVEADHAPVE
jgi:hypothetical protein